MVKMASTIHIPPGLTELLQNFTIQVLREQPSPEELVDFAAAYFNNLKESGGFLNSPETKGVKFSQEFESDSDEEPFQPPKINNRRRQSVSAELYNPEEESDDSDTNKVVVPKSDEQRSRLNSAIKNILLFRALDDKQLHEVLDAMFEKKVEPSDHVIDQGDDGDNFYVIDAGDYDVFVSSDGKSTTDPDKKVFEYHNSGFFGELALMYNMPRAATVVATSNGSLWALDRHTFRRIVMRAAYNKRRLYEGLLESVPMLKAMEQYERMNVADALVTRSYEDGEDIILQGETGDCMYFVEDGEVKITAVSRDKESITSKTSVPTELKNLHKGGYFGELALLTKQPRAASAHAVGPTKCAVLDVGAFERLLGPCMAIMERDRKDYEETIKQLFGPNAHLSDLLSKQESELSNQ